MDGVFRQGRSLSFGMNAGRAPSPSIFQTQFPSLASDSARDSIWSWTLVALSTVVAIHLVLLVNIVCLRPCGVLWPFSVRAGRLHPSAHLPRRHSCRSSPHRPLASQPVEPPVAGRAAFLTAVVADVRAFLYTSFQLLGLLLLPFPLAENKPEFIVSACGSFARLKRSLTIVCCCMNDFGCVMVERS